MMDIKNKSFLICLVVYLGLSIFLNLYNVSFYLMLKPYFWLGILLSGIFLNRHRDFKSHNFPYLFFSLITSLVLVLIDFTLGYLFGFTNSPFNHDFISIFKNFFNLALPIMGIEAIRFWFLKNKQSKLVIIIFTILLTLLGINYHSLLSLKQIELYKYISSFILPLIGLNLLNTYLILKSKYPLSFIFSLINNLILITFPIFPNFNWYVLSSLRLIKIIIIFLLFNYFFVKESRVKNFKKDLISYLISIMGALVFLFFMLGFFKYEPIAILSQSMYPTLNRGDIVIYKKLTEEELANIKPNTIIVYKSNNTNIIHRVIARKKINNKITYVTKGDNNAVEDLKEVDTEDILGVYSLKIKYLGYPSVWLNDYLKKDAAFKT